MNYGPGYYAPPPPQPVDLNKVTPTDVLVPIGLSVFCGIGGFVWGLVRMAQGHHKPGWVAIGINAGLWALGFAIWVVFFVLVAGAMHSVPSPSASASTLAAPVIPLASQTPAARSKPAHP